MISRDQNTVTLERLDRSGDTFKVVRRRVDTNECKRDKIAKVDGDASSYSMSLRTTVKPLRDA